MATIKSGTNIIYFRFIDFHQMNLLLLKIGFWVRFQYDRYYIDKFTSLDGRFKAVSNEIIILSIE